MNSRFAEHVAALPALCEQLCTSEPLTESQIRQVNCGGVYLFSENGEPMYVGRTKNLKNRYRTHCGISSKENSAAFAFRLARIVTDNIRPTYKKVGSRNALMQDASFAAAFREAKFRIERMELRFIREEDDMQQALLEIYVSLHTRAEHNTFNTT